MVRNNRHRIGVLLMSLTCITDPGGALARTAFDGDWSVVISTSNGACVSSYRSGVQIFEGAVVAEGGAVNVQGRVTPKGAVKVTVQSGGQWASGHGQLTKNRGGGVWRGQGTSGVCSGTWIAERR